MNKIYWFFLASLLFLISCGTSKFKLTQTTCNLKELPSGIIKPPVFSWKATSIQRGEKQIAYHIIVSDNISKLRNNEGNIWNSGKIDSDKSIGIDYKGENLKSSTKYFWKVKIWSNYNEVSDWSDIAEFNTGIIDSADWLNAKWIAYEQMTTDKLVPGIPSWGHNLSKYELPRTVIPLFRKEFNLLNKEIDYALLNISGIGQYEAEINGNKVSEYFLSPGWTDYDKTCLYNTYDITNKLKSGDNAIGVIVGNGFYNINKERYKKLVIAYGKPKMICNMVVRYKDGTSETIVSDETWKTSPSPISFTSIYSGESYDARKEQNDWDNPGFNDSEWVSPFVVDNPGVLKPQTNYPIKVMEEYTPVNKTKTSDNEYVFDFGQNASGIVQIKVEGSKGDTVTIWPAELLKDDGSITQKFTGGPTFFQYILKGEGIEIWKPRFAYYGFRYAKVEGSEPISFTLKEKGTTIHEVKMLHTRSSAPLVGDFECSDTLFNDIFTLINYGIKSNLMSVLTDCPHREKLGWLEQTYLMGGSVHYNFDVYHLYKKLVNDMMDAQKENGFVPNFVPEYMDFGGDFSDSPEWGSASIILPWLLYKWYGDLTVMKEAWPMMEKYLAYLKSKSENHIISYGLGDWYDLGPNKPGYSQLTPYGVTATAIYYYDAHIMSEMAGVIGKTYRKIELTAQAKKIKEAFNNKFYNKETNVIATGSQTSMALPYSIGLVDKENKEAVLKNLVDSINKNNKSLTAGDIGFHFLIEALTEGGYSQLIYDMNKRDDIPGYAYQLKKGATALTESWQALPTKSNNHLMLGHLMQWFYEGIGGINQSETSVGYNNVTISPVYVKEINYVSAVYNSISGEIVSKWKRKGNQINLDIEIPFNKQATVYLPANILQIKESGKELAESQGIFEISGTDNDSEIKIGSGKYLFSFELE